MWVFGVKESKSGIQIVLTSARTEVACVHAHLLDNIAMLYIKIWVFGVKESKSGIQIVFASTRTEIACVHARLLDKIAMLYITSQVLVLIYFDISV